MKAQKTTQLFWNNQGAVSCEKHAPYRESDTWQNQQWQTITDADRDALGPLGQCEICGR